MANIAVFPGSFDPITKGHENIVKRALPLFDKIIIAVGVNSQKKYLFPLDQRLTWIKNTFNFEQKVTVETYEGLTVRFCLEKDARYIIRGLRNAGDFQFEKGIAQMNREMVSGIETIFLMSTPELSAINSTIVRDIIRNGGDVSKFIPNAIEINGDF
ncbi:MAG: pantetheine-phosphate adenylyltransferase [Cryomorphaceae bacterium]|nr:MAG: pantetheine-phosphate adenylyltransferase [Cryomorphaceae bacterium]